MGPETKKIKIAGTTLVVVLFFLLIFLLSPDFDIDAFFHAFRSSTFKSLSVTAIIVLFTILTSTIRFYLLGRTARVRDSWENTHRINVFSLCYSFIALPAIAQTIGRIRHSRRENRERMVLVTTLEKVVSAGLLVATALSLTYIAFRKVVFEPEIFAAAGILVALAGLFGALSFSITMEKRDLYDIKTTVRAAFSLDVIAVAGLTLAIHLSTIAAMTGIALSIDGSLSALSLFGGFSLVVLATALPVGFGGWGVREATAAGVFTYYGLPAEIGVAAGVLYGFIYMAVLGANALWAATMRPAPVLETQWTQPAGTEREESYWKAGLILLVVLLPFQLRIPTQTGALTLNLADPIAFVIGGSFLVAALNRFDWRNIWRQNLFWTAIAVLVALIGVGWIIGFLRFGSNDWATTNRLFGLIAVFSYLFSGAALTSLLGHDFLRKWVKLGAIVVVLTALAQFALIIPLGEFGATFFNWTTGVSGFYQDRNAFSLLALILLSSLLILHEKKGNTRKGFEWFVFAVSTVLGYIIVFSGSRSGIGGLIVVILFAFVKQKRISLSIMLTIGTLSILSRMVQVKLQALGHVNPSNIPMSFMSGRAPASTSLAISQTRLDTWMSGISMFFEHPIFGGGLGAILEYNPKVVHNVFIWIMAEMGVVGLILLIPLLVALFKEVFRDKFRFSTNSYLLFCLCVVFGGFSLVQDISYQRSVWLMIGLLMANSSLKAADDR